jgi:PIN domain nuclease of toxin-antitoxin system
MDIAAAVAALGRALGDPDDRAIVSTARVHRLKLVTSEKRIIASGLVPVVE